MNHKSLRALAWTLIVLLGLGVVTDFLCVLGLVRGWQYIYNAFYFCVALPCLIGVAMRDNLEDYAR